MERTYLNKGYKLYIAVPLTYWTGVFRILDQQNFGREKAIGFIIDISFTIVLMILQ